MREDAQMSRKNNRRRRQDRRKRKRAWEDFHAKYANTGGSMPLFILVSLSRSIGYDYARKVKLRSEMRNFGGNRLLERKLKLAHQFKSCWRDGVDALGVEGWGRDRLLTDERDFQPITFEHMRARCNDHASRDLSDDDDTLHERGILEAHWVTKK